MTSSILFKNSGLNVSLTADKIFSFLTSFSFPNPIAFVFNVDPAFDVIIIIVFSKLTTLPSESVSLASSNTCNNKLNTSGCAFSISSNSIIEYGFLLTFSVNCPPSPYPTYPGAEPINLETLYFSIYSLISTRIIFSSDPNISYATVFANSVLPTPVGPTNINDGGLFVV